MSTKINILLWVLSFILMGALVVYQRMTGPTYPIKGEVTIDSKVIEYKLLRSAETGSDAKIEILCDSEITGVIKHRFYTSNSPWTTDSMTRRGNTLIATIKSNIPAHKDEYFISLFDSNGKEYKLNDEAVKIRFKGQVPSAVLIPHILFMFLALWFATRTALEAIFKGDKTLKYSVWSLVTLFVGGIILGPIVQKYAFDAFWTGWPLGEDLTDNKTAFNLIFWIIAVWMIKKNSKNVKWAVIAAFVSLAMYLIPHSVLGSQIDYSKAEAPVAGSATFSN